MKSELIIVIKASGAEEPFSEKKVYRSMEKAGIPFGARKQAMERIKAKLYDRIPTSIIYKQIVDFLNNSKYLTGSNHYCLKLAIMDLGPTGYPFEKFIALILKEHGYKTDVGMIVAGKCVDHEVDVVAQKDNEHFMVECKFHNKPGTRSDVKVALYIKARFEDVAVTWKQKPGHKTMFHQAWLVTNTKLTSDAITFGECVGMKMVAWNYPQKGSLQNLIEKTGLYPLTCLTSLTKQQKRKLLAQDIVLCRDLLQAESSTLNFAGISQEEEQHMREEARLTCSHNSKGGE